ncbi:MAG: ATP-dependent DNA helicase RecG [Gammaproteobacteria bacterium]|nr:ATP-dependent DNA helicase RecG [Gammaproteobacteria bacterium]MBM4223399.1 ATP-dependent DNA helicase RecG [Gammaproteobacteria bacterium]MBM4229218.1 ATP-dependent DNA helicase RecG [Gammaproteobacteria bacterium]
MTEPREQRPVTALRGVGDALAARLAVLGVETVQDLLFVLPTRYEDRTRVQPIGALLAGGRAVVEGEVQLTEVVFRRRRQMLCRIADGSGFLTLRFFHFSSAQQQGLERGNRLRCFGEVRRGPMGLEIVHPEYRRIFDERSPLEESLTPVYPATEGVSQGRLRVLIAQALRELDSAGVRDWLPPAILAPLGLPPLREALRYVHRPPVDADLEELDAGKHPVQRRLAFEELLTHQVVMRRLRESVRTDAAWVLTDESALEARFISGLPYELTRAQRRVLDEVDADLVQDRPMVRLVQGDVGCGKTVVAAAAAARAVGSGRQAVLMAPTELLAEQHQRNLDAWFRPLGITVALVSGSQPARTRRSALEAIACGEVRIAVGTHALFQESMQFRELALVIVDEQHRFGVQQRLRLAEKGVASGRHPHQLIMTATPIPRTLAMTAYADLDVSVIDALPPGRTPVKTVVVAETRRSEVVARIDAACRSGRQAYWVCPLIEESEELQCQAAEETAAVLTEALPHLVVRLVHGRMKPKEKDATMLAFKAGKIHLLVATTVIEVGVDVPNATLMVIENAERMGLAQLHQLRGRVGRGTYESSCVLLYRAPMGPLARARLNAIRDTNDGFEIARRDLELRGPGELLGTRQTGLARMRVADLIRDADLLPRVQEAAEILLARHPDRIAPLTTRWIGTDDRYGRIG